MNTFNNPTRTAEPKPTTLVEIRVKTLANMTPLSNPPAHTVKFADLQKYADLLATDETIIEWSYNFIGDNTHYSSKGLASL